jgi:hypothetical protein
MERVTALVCEDLRRLAAWHLKAESDIANLQATSLVHEVESECSMAQQLVYFTSRATSFWMASAY